MAGRGPRQAQERELVVVPVGTPEEAQAALRRAMRIFADWVRRERAKAPSREVDLRK